MTWDVNEMGNCGGKTMKQDKRKIASHKEFYLSRKARREKSETETEKEKSMIGKSKE